MSAVIVRHGGILEYEGVWQRMSRWTSDRQADTPDEFWWLQHRPVFTLGQAGKREHVLAPGDIPLVHSDRGGQVTYHGPGQLIGYLLIDIKRAGIGVRQLVTIIEQQIVQLLAVYGVEAAADPGAPGVYVAGRKIAALGLRVRKGRTYHGLSLNVDLNLEPFSRINPCGYAGLEVTSMKALGVDVTLEAVARVLNQSFVQQFGYDSCLETDLTD